MAAGSDRFEQASAASLEAVYAAEIRRLIGLGTILTRDSAAGEDLAHDVFVKLANRTRRDPAYLRPPVWPLLRTIAVRLAIQRRRTIARELLRLGRLWERDSSAQWEPEADLIDWRTSLLKLPPRMRACVVLFYGEDLSTASAAAELGCSPRTVENQLRSARQRLAESLAEDRNP